MKLNVLLGAAALLGAFVFDSADGRPADDPTTRRLILPRPLLLRLGEEVSLRLGGSGAASSSSSLPTSSLSSSSSSSSSFQLNQALLQLTQHLLQARAEQQTEVLEGEEDEGDGEIGKRSEESPISLDLTFHLLREVLEMARAEQIAQQADSNRKMMDILGK